MGTVVNGKVWDGACVNGKVVNGLVKNGVVFYKKDTTPSVLYKRRIMVGDNLNSKVLYITLPPDFVVQNNETIIETDVYNAITKTTNSADTGTPNVDLCYGSSEFTFVGLIGKTQYEIPSDFGTVTSIIDTDDAYRHLYIEDPNIRPVQVGDVITRNTKFYFTIPDDIFSRSNIGINPIRIGRDSSLSVLDDSNIIQFYINNIASSDNEVVIFENGELVKNKSSMIVAETYGSYFEGTVTSVESDSLVYNMTFVDVRTLGA